MRRIAAILTAVVTLASGCGTESPGMTGRSTPTVAVLPSGVQIPAKKLGAETTPCRQSLRPQGPPAVTPGSTMAKIRAQGQLIVGVGPSAYGLTYRNPQTGQVEGFETNIAKAIAFAIFGDENRILFRAVNTNERIPAIRGEPTPDGRLLDKVDIVLAAMTMTCKRAQDVAFSAEYYPAEQKVLVHQGSGVREIEDLRGKKVCASSESTNLRIIHQHPAGLVPVEAANTSDCLLLLQQGRIDAVSTGDVILAGLAMQDPGTEIVGRSLNSEPTGIAMAKESEDLVRFVNAVLEQLIADGRWQAWRNTWLRPRLKEHIEPPKPQYKPE